MAVRTRATSAHARAAGRTIQLLYFVILPEGVRPSDPPTRSLARRFAGTLRSRGSLARSRRRSAASRMAPAAAVSCSNGAWIYVVDVVSPIAAAHGAGVPPADRVSSETRRSRHPAHADARSATPTT